MQIISHRGLWYDFEKENNKRIAFEQSFDKNYGTETDLRDICGKIVISHNMPKGDEITFENVLEIMNGRNLPLALNIKADGQADDILAILKKYNHTNYFTFDMSIPDMVVQLKRGVNVYTGLSDILEVPVLLENAKGIWLDSFNSEWFDEKIITDMLGRNKKICIVSADLHGRDVTEQWGKLKSYKSIQTDDVMLCTNIAERATEFFEV